MKITIITDYTEEAMTKTEYQFNLESMTVNTDGSTQTIELTKEDLSELLSPLYTGTFIKIANLLKENNNE